MGSARQRRLLRAGAKAPDFTLANLAGGQTALHELLPNGPVVLAFFKVTCPVCQLTFPFLERIHRERAPSSLSIYGISQDDAGWTTDFNQRYGITFPTLLDTEEDNYPASNAYGISTVPSLFLVEPGGTIALTLEGFSKRDIQDLAGRAGVNPFRPGDYVPEWKAG